MVAADVAGAPLLTAEGALGGEHPNVKLIEESISRIKSQQKL